MNLPRVSLGVPVYNGAPFLEQTLESLLAQTYGDFEIIAADNASTDDTLAILQRYCRADSRLRILTADENRGAAWNYNRVFAASRGEFFKWAAADDVCRTRYLAACVAALDETPAAVLAYPRTRIIDGENADLGPYQDNLHLTDSRPWARFGSLLRHMRECNAVFGLIRREALATTRQIGAYASSDLVLLAELALRGGFCELGEELFLRRDHAAQSMRAHPDAAERDRWFDTHRKVRHSRPNWRLLSEFDRAISLAGLRGVARFRCRMRLGWWVRNKYPEMARELLPWSRRALARAS